MDCNSPSTVRWAYFCYKPLKKRNRSLKLSFDHFKQWSVKLLLFGTAVYGKCGFVQTEDYKYYLLQKHGVCKCRINIMLNVEIHNKKITRLIAIKET